MSNEIITTTHNDVMRTLRGIEVSAMVDIQVAGGFYGRLHQLLLNLGKQKSPEEFKAALEEIKAGPPKSEYSYHILTLLTLITEVENCAEKQGKMKSVEVKG
jgi:hypothetical protein